MFRYHLNALSILRTNPPKLGGGLKFEPKAGIAQKAAFCKGLNAFWFRLIRVGIYFDVSLN